MPCGAGDGKIGQASCGGWGRGAAEEDDTDEGTEDDGEDRAEGGRGEGGDQGGGEGEGEAAGVGGERALHGEDGLGDDGDGDQLQAVQDRVESRREVGLGEGKGDEEDGGGEREAGPGGEGSEPAGAEEAEGEGDLAAGGSGKGLGEGDDLGVGLGGAPAAAEDELGVEVAEMGDGTAEGEAAETQEGEEDLERRAGFGRWGGGGIGWGKSTVCVFGESGHARAIQRSLHCSVEMT